MWLAADELRGQVDAAEYKHVVLGLVFLKYISDAFQEHRQWLLDTHPDESEDRDAYTAGRDSGGGIFWVPKEARWSYLQANATQPTIGKLVDDAMDAIERDNPSLKAVLPKDYARPTLDKVVLGRLIDLIGTIGLGDRENRSKDVLGRVYEYFLGQFASAEGKKGGEFYTPRCVVRLLVEMIEPFKGRVYDPCCGSSGMFVQSEEFIREHGGTLGDISIYGQESNPTTWKLAKMNLAIRGIEANLGGHNADTFRNDLHKDLKADFVLANPPFNMSAWGGEGLREDVRWKFGVPPPGNANYAWIEHMIHHLAPSGVAGFVMANGSVSSKTSGQGEIRKAIVEADLVDCIVALPNQLFYGSPIPVILWVLSRDKSNGGYRARQGETLFIDARKLGRLVDRKHKELSSEEISRIAGAYHAWRGKDRSDGHEDVAGFAKSVSIVEMRKHGFMLSPGRYVGTDDSGDTDEPISTAMARLVFEFRDASNEGARLTEQVERNLKSLGYGK
jgi:type I restriction enzyme M protein